MMVMEDRCFMGFGIGWCFGCGAEEVGFGCHIAYVAKSMAFVVAVVIWITHIG